MVGKIYELDRVVDSLNQHSVGPLTWLVGLLMW